MRRAGQHTRTHIHTVAASAHLTAHGSAPPPAWCRQQVSPSSSRRFARARLAAAALGSCSTAVRLVADERTQDGTDPGVTHVIRRFQEKHHLHHLRFAFDEACGRALVSLIWLDVRHRASLRSAQGYYSAVPRRLWRPQQQVYFRIAAHYRWIFTRVRAAQPLARVRTYLSMWCVCLSAGSDGPARRASCLTTFTTRRSSSLRVLGLAYAVAARCALGGDMPACVCAEDMSIAPDFFEYFAATGPLLDKGASTVQRDAPRSRACAAACRPVAAVCVGMERQRCGRVRLRPMYERAIAIPRVPAVPLTRVVSAIVPHGLLPRAGWVALRAFPAPFFSAACGAPGWMMTAKLWTELRPKWAWGFWDDWLRLPENVRIRGLCWRASEAVSHVACATQRRARSCIFPEMNRVYTFGSQGASRCGVAQRMAASARTDVPACAAVSSSTSLTR